MVRFISLLSGSILKRFVGLAAVVLVSSLLSSPAKSQQISNDRPIVAGHNFYPEVRLRKLHLVRPDLIPYPIFYDIYC